ncbi:MAG TPA: hypothetical protein VF723_14415 [Pyrinomonadaceae bacterium]|jgi:hypothetical protein
MSIFDIFRRKTDDKSESGGPKIEFGLRGEDITYRLPDKEMYIQFTWINWPRVYTESMDKWKDGSMLTKEEKKKVFGDVVNFIRRKRKMPIVVINSDDPSKDVWEHLCSLNQPVVKGIEYTSDEEDYRSERSMWLECIKAGKGVVLDGVEVRSEKELDEAMQRLRKGRAV